MMISHALLATVPGGDECAVTRQCSITVSRGHIFITSVAPPFTYTANMNCTFTQWSSLDNKEKRKNLHKTEFVEGYGHLRPSLLILGFSRADIMHTIRLGRFRWAVIHYRY